MAMNRAKLDTAEFARQGEAIYERDVLPRVRPSDDGKFVLIDIESGDYEIDAKEMEASKRLLARRPKGQVWMRRVGSKSSRRFGTRFVSKS